MSTLLVEIDGTDVTNVAIAGSWTPRLNRPAQAQITIPMDSAIGDAGSRLKITINSTLVFHGFILTCETDTNKDTGTTVYNAQDPMELWQWRPVRDDGGDFADPDLIATYVTAPQILQAMLMNTEGSSTAQGNPALVPPADAEGPTFLTFGSFAGSGADLSGAFTDWPMKMSDFTSLMMSTGQLDAVITPTDPGGGIMGTIDGYNGDFGTDLSGSISFDYGQGNFNVDSLRWNRDMTNVVNKYWLYAGPKIATAADPQSIEHWCYNVTGDDGGLAYPPGGANSPPASSTDNQLGVRRVDSQVTAGPNGTGYGVRMLVDIIDGFDECQGVGSVGREFQRRLWQEYSWAAAVPREIIHVTPTRDTEIGAFKIGDLVTVSATSAVRGGFSGVQRIYAYTISWDEDSVLSLGELQTSSDAEGI